MRLGPKIAAIFVVAVFSAGHAQTARRLATIAALHQYPGYFHLQNVVVHGEFDESGGRPLLRADERQINVLLNDVKTTSGLLEVRGQLLDVGRLEHGDPRLANYDGAADPERWPRPGEDLVLSVTAVTQTQLAATPTLRALALQPWRFEGQKVTLVGQFRGRNLFGDLPSAPAKSKYDFVLRSADAAVWVTDLRPRGRGFDLNVDARVDTGRWMQVTGTVSQDRGLVTVLGSTITTAEAPEATPAEEEPAAPVTPPEPGEVIFSTPTEGDIDVSPAGPVRLQFSRGLDEKSLAGHIRVSYARGQPDAPAIEVETSYDLGSRAVEIRFKQRLDAFRQVTLELLEGVKTFDGAPVQPFTLTFSIGN